MGTHEIQVNAKTFFDVDEAAVARLEIKANPKPVKVKTKPVLIHVGKVTLTFADASGDPLGVVTKFSELKIDGKNVPWTQVGKPLVAGQIEASGQASSKQVLVYEIKQGKHKVQVTATVDGSIFVASGTIEVKKSEQVFKLKLVKSQ